MNNFYNIFTIDGGVPSYCARIIKDSEYLFIIALQDVTGENKLKNMLLRVLFTVPSLDGALVVLLSLVTIFTSKKTKH